MVGQAIAKIADLFCDEFIEDTEGLARYEKIKWFTPPVVVYGYQHIVEFLARVRGSYLINVKIYGKSTYLERWVTAEEIDYNYHISMPRKVVE